MRSSRLLIRKKFTGGNTSPIRMPDSTKPEQTRRKLVATPIGHVFNKQISSLASQGIVDMQGDKFVHGLLERVSRLSLQTAKFSGNMAKGPELPKEHGLNISHFKKFLHLRNLEFAEIHSCLKMRIPKHLLAPSLVDQVEPHDIETPTVFINKKTGDIVIPKYGLTGSWADFEHLINAWLQNRLARRSESTPDDYPVFISIDQSLSSRLEASIQSLRPVEGMSGKEFKELLRNLKLLQRDYTAKDFERFQARVNEGLDEIFFPVRYIDGSIVGVRRVYCEEGKIVETHYPRVQRNKLLPFPHGIHEAMVQKSNSVIIVGSILDSVALSSRLDFPVISLPDSTNLHPDHLPFLGQFDSILLWLTNDVQATHNSKLFVQKIDEKKCRIVSGHFPSPATAVKEKMDVKEILASSRSCYHEFLTTFEDLRENVYLEFLRSDELLGVKWQRFDDINALLGGFRRGELTVFTGRTGSGKTTFLSEYSLDLCMQGVNTLWCSFEVKNTRLLKMMLKQFSMINLDDQLNQFEKVGDKFSKLPLYLTDFHGSQKIANVMEAMSHAVYVHDITHVIIDNMQFMLGAHPSIDPFKVQDSTIQLMRQFATAHNCHVTLVIHPRKESEAMLSTNSIYGGAKATQEADNVLLLQEEDNPHSFFKKKSIQVVKNRYAGDLGSTSLLFTKPILTFSKKAADHYKKKVLGRQRNKRDASASNLISSET